MTDGEAGPARAPRRRALGRGLDALLSSHPEPEDEAAADAVLVNIDPNRVRSNPQQPRRFFDEGGLAALADSIRLHGLLQPIVVERDSDGYVLVAGERRLRAAQLAGTSPIAAIVRPAAESERQLLELALTENLNREDLNPIEEAGAYARLADTFGLSHEAIALRLGRKRPTISNAIRLLGLSPVVQEAVATGRISASHGRALASLPDHADQEELAIEVESTGMPSGVLDTVVQERLSRRRGVARDAKPPRASRTSLSADDEAVRRGLERALGVPVALRRRARGGDLTLAFASDEDLGSLYERLGGPPL